MNFRDKLKKAMKDHSWKQVDVASMTGRSVSTISNWLSGKQIPTETRCDDIASALGLPVDYFREDRSTDFKRITIEQTAKILGVGKDTVRLGLQQGVFPWGYAVQTSAGWTYIINGPKLEQVEGVKI